jgi:hypothetical protein
LLRGPDRREQAHVTKGDAGRSGLHGGRPLESFRAERDEVGHARRQAGIRGQRNDLVAVEDSNGRRAG